MKSLKTCFSIVLVVAIMVTMNLKAQAQDSSGQSVSSSPPGIHNLAAGLDYEWSVAPIPSHPDTGRALTDGQYGNVQDYTDPAWTGHLDQKMRTVVFDMGAEKSITSVKAHFLEDYGAHNILFPLTVSVYVSNDKVHWGSVANLPTLKFLQSGPPREQTYEWDGSKSGLPSDPEATMAYARYIKVTFYTHATALIFIDEIEVWGADGRQDGAVEVPPYQPAYQEVGEATASVRNLVFLPNGYYAGGKGDFPKEKIIPFISYVNEQGEPVDWLFDSVFFAAGASPSGRDVGYGNGTLEDWKWHFEKTYNVEHGDIRQLEEAAKEVALKLNQPDHKIKVGLMVPNPGFTVSDFGDVDGDGVSENFNAGIVGEETAAVNREKAIKWWLDQAKAKWDEGNYIHLELAGMYWLDEEVSTDRAGERLVRTVSDLVHAQQMKLFWVPHFNAYKSFLWKDLGVDAAAFQPNYFFEDMNINRLEDATDIAKQYGMGIEVEFDNRMITDDVFRKRYIEYLDAGVKYGYMQPNVFKAYYQGNDAVYEAAKSTVPKTRILYDWLYQFLQGTYQKTDFTAPTINVLMNGKELLGDATVPESEAFSFTWEALDEDSGIADVKAVFDRGTYQAGSTIDLAGKPGKHRLDITAIDMVGNTAKKTFWIEVTTSVDEMIKVVTRLEAEGNFTTRGNARAVQVLLDVVKKFQEQGDIEKAMKHLRDMNIILNIGREKALMSEKAYDIVQTDVDHQLGSDLALHQKAEASSVESARPDLSPDQAVDGVYGTRWSSNYTDDSWFTVDLGEVKDFDTIVIDWEAAHARTFKILVSNDKEQWTNVIDQDGTFEGKDGKQTIRLTTTTARYVKLQGIQRATPYGYSFYAFEVHKRF
ncbi:DUF4855 domain-containing protein [Paenibacillus guangzhouensis]|uniref:DUF4855 domain-containing protein n=1 Tax=Paenibacillus guangzhouensis TaxID=1473112 RepID=UPI001266A869|nr:DUF4855 domain-containing protein [Paenibacillus guangzhouensis]